MPQARKPLILALTDDYFIVPRMEDAAVSLGFEFEVVADLGALGVEGAFGTRRIPLTEPLEGPDATFVRGVVERTPALILVDLTNQKIPWERWIQILKTSAATRRIPIVAYGPHVEVEVLDKASSAGADQVISRGKLQSSLPAIIHSRAHVLDYGELNEACLGNLSELASLGLELLNSGEYYEAHEYLEHAWLEAPEMEGYLYRSLLQISVAYLHVGRHNYAGAVKMMLRVRRWLDPLPDHCRGVDVGALKQNLEAFSKALDQWGETGLSDFDRSHLMPVPLL